jgi:hypothetical protein
MPIPAGPTTDIFDLADLPSWLQVPEVDEQTAIRVRRAANGWLMSATGLTSWPDPITDDLWAWAIELAGIAHRNPTGLTSEAVDDYQARFDSKRRREILDEAKACYGGGNSPQFSFPTWDWEWKSSDASTVTS